VSRAIVVRVSESVDRTIHVEDGVVAPLEMLPILAPERMAELLAGELAALGFVRAGAACRRIEPDGTEVVIDLVASTIAVTLGADAHVDDTVELSAEVAEEVMAERGAWTEAAMRDDAARRLEQRAAERADAVRRAVTARLEGRLGDLRREIDGAIGQATIAALTEKAAALGHIEDMQRDAAGNVTIRVRL
jgi:hypothetical protein